MTDLKGLINFGNWPRDFYGSPLFTCSEDALFYAKLIFTNGDECFHILSLRFLALMELEHFCLNDDPDLDDMMKLAVKAQLYRECLEEIRRIRIANKNL